MIEIDFFDSNQRFLVKHKLDDAEMECIPYSWLRNYCDSILKNSLTASFAKISYKGLSYRVLRNGCCNY